MSASGSRGLLAACLLALGACATPLPPPHLYSLEVAPLSAPAPAPFRGTIAVGPTSVADLVDRSQIVMRPSANRVELLDAHRWAEPLRSAVPRLLAAQLSARLGETRVTAEPHLLARPDYRITLDLAHFEYGPGPEARLEIQWSVRRTRDDAVASGRTVEREPISAPGVEAFVAAQSRSLARVAAELEAAVRALQAR